MFRVIITLFVLFMSVGRISAQSASVKNLAKSTFLLVAYDKDGNKTGSSYGVFTTADGEAVSSWTTLSTAARAEVTDFNGKTYPVKSLIGANELYDVCRFRVYIKEAKPASLAQSSLAAGGKVWLVSSENRKPVCDAYEIEREEGFMDKYAYYVFAYNAKNGASGMPFANDGGQVIGLLQQSETSLETHAVDARFAAQLAEGPLAVSGQMYAKTGLRLQLPSEHKDALLMLMLAGEQGDSAKYVGYINDYISAFPHEVDGYSTSALEKVAAEDFAGADADMQKALRLATNKAEAHAEYSRVMYHKLIYSVDSLYTGWTLDRALQEAEKAYALDAQPSYRHREAQILFSKGEYQKACDIFSELSKGAMPTSEVFFEVAQCKTQLGAKNEEIIVLLDSAVAACKRPFDNTAAPYVLSRGQMYNKMGDYRKAIADFNVYDTLMYGRANAEFYFTRYQCEVKVRQYQQALNDIAHAAYVGGENTPFYVAEMASLQLRVNQLEDAVKSADLCLGMTPDNTDALVIKGLALINLKKKAEGMAALEKAKQLGDTRAEEYMQKYK